MLSNLFFCWAGWIVFCHIFVFFFFLCFCLCFVFVCFLFVCFCFCFVLFCFVFCILLGRRNLPKCCISFHSRLKYNYLKTKIEKLDFLCVKISLDNSYFYKMISNPIKSACIKIIQNYLSTQSDHSI